MQRTAPSSPPRRQEGGGSPAFMMASRIRTEQGPERAAQYLAAMEPYLAPAERAHIAYALGLPLPPPKPRYDPLQDRAQSFNPLGALGNMSGLDNIGSIMKLMQLINGLQSGEQGGPAQLLRMFGNLMGGNGKKTQ